MQTLKYKSSLLIVVLIIGILCSACARKDTNTLDVVEQMETAPEESGSVMSVEEKMAQVVSTFEPQMSDTEILNMEVEHNIQSKLSVPTDVKKIDGMYFIVDCYNNQVIYSDHIGNSLTEWKVMSKKITKGHTIASDGQVYLIDDTENNRILVYQKEKDKFIHIQTLENIGDRPHYILYDADSQAFYVLSSMSGEIYILKVSDNREVYVSDIKTIDTITSTYCRSFTIDKEAAYFPGTNNRIVKTSFPDFAPLEEYVVPDEISGLAQIVRISQYYYLTVSTNAKGDQNVATIIRTNDLASLQNGIYEDVYSVLEPDRQTAGTPYGISEFDGHYYMVEHRHNHGLFQFDVVEDELCNVKILH